MKRNHRVLFVIMLLSGNLFAQGNPWYKESFAGYASYVSKKFGIACKMPPKFTDMNQYNVMQRIHKDRVTGSMYGPVFQANDKECIVMYPALPHYVSKKDMELAKNMVMLNRKLNNDTSTVEPKVGNNSTFPRSQITAEIKAAAFDLFDDSGKPFHDSIRFVFTDHVTIIAGKKARKMFNADSVYFYDIRLEEPYQQSYSYCMGMALSKKDRATLLFKWYFTPEGRKRKNKYINMLSKQVWYSEDFIGISD